MESRHEFKDDEDDVFYCQLRRQVLFLTEDEEEYKLENKHSNFAKGSYEQRPITTTLLPGSYFTWLEVESADSVPAWLTSLWRTTSNGTGVFIPRAVKKPFRRHRHRAARNKTKTTYPAEGQNMYSSVS
ncbi:hypothetical protein LguiA_000546 [Lonicera macranthoides]